MSLSVWSRRLTVGIAGCALAIGGLVAPAAAHDPIFLSADQTTPDTGPYMPDGSISWALYGSVLEPGDTRGFEFDLRDGDDLVLSLLIPNLSPELELSDDELPIVELTSPDGTTRTIRPNVRDEFDEPFSRTSYLTLYEESGPGEAGRYQGIVIGSAPARFSLAIGINEIFFTETERSGDRPASFAEITAPLTAWYSTPPGADAPVGELADGEGEIDLEMIEGAMNDGEADAPEGALAIPVDETPADDDAPTQAPTDEPADAADQPADAADEPADAADEPADAADEPATDETAAGSADDPNDSGTSLAWVAPVGLVAIAAIGGAVFARKRSVS